MIFKPELVSSSRGERVYQLYRESGIIIRLYFSGSRFNGRMGWSSRISFLFSYNPSPRVEFLKRIIGFLSYPGSSWKDSWFNKDYRNNEQKILRSVIKMTFGDQTDEEL